MKSPIQRSLAAAALGVVWLAQTASAGITNAVVWWDSFESYPDGTLIDGTNGWSADILAGGAVTTNSAVTGLLTNTLACPLPSATHSNVLQVTCPVRNDTGSATGGVVAMEFMALPLQMTSLPPGDTNMQYSLCVSTNARLTIWYRDAILMTNQWLELTNSPPIATGVWTRFTVQHDYSNRMFQVQVNQGNPVLDNNAGWTAGGATQGGSWFYMVQTNASLARVLADGGPAYLDDLLVTNRSLAWTGTGFTESTANNGTLAPPAITVSLAYDTFAGADNENFATTGRATVTNVPTGLTAVVTRTSATLVSITLTNAALLHESANSISNLGVRFTDTAFTHGNAWDVSSIQRTNLSVTYLDTPRLSCNTNRFGETVANDGSLDNSTPLLITLTNGTFSGTDGSQLTNYVVFSNLPAGLWVSMIRTNGGTNAVVQLLGQATANDAANNTTVTLAFQDGAFNVAPASSVFGGTTNLLITFIDPSVLTYTTTLFTETAANNGAVSGAALSLSNKTFSATNGENLVASHKAAGVGVPGGLTLQVIVTNSQHATLSFTGNAVAHAAANSITNLGVTFDDTAFVGANAAGVIGGTRSDLIIQFNDPPVVSASGGPFRESGANNGAIGNSVTIALTGDTFTAGPFVAGLQYAVTNVPTGMTLGLTYADGRHVTAALAGKATNHAAANSLTNLHLTFSDGMFTTVAASNITGHPIDFAVQFLDQPVVTYSSNTFHESSAGYIDNRAPITITVAGDTFAGANGQDFVQAGWFMATNLPTGLTAQVTRDSDTQLSVRLTGAAITNAASNSVSNLAFAFLPSAFGTVDWNQVVNYQASGFQIQFVDDNGFVNLMPYQESFESYSNGLWLAGSNGWSALYSPDAAIVTNDAVVTSNLMAYLAAGHTQFPIVTTHTQVLYVQDHIATAVSNESSSRVYVDFMTTPVGFTAEIPSDTNLQYAFYVSTNGQLVIWHQDWTGAHTNQWLALTNAGTISTSSWVRFTVTLDYTHNLYQVQVNEARPVIDARGWTEGGTSPTGSWFHMVQTNGCLSLLRMSGVGVGYLDDLTVRTSLPQWFGVRAGSIFEFR